MVCFHRMKNIPFFENCLIQKKLNTENTFTQKYAAINIKFSPFHIFNIHVLSMQNSWKAYCYTCIMLITENVKSVKIQQSAYQDFLQEMENAYLFSPGRFRIHEPSEKHLLPINILVVRNQIILLIILQGIKTVIPESSFYSLCFTIIRHQFTKSTTSYL